MSSNVSFSLFAVFVKHIVARSIPADMVILNTNESIRHSGIVFTQMPADNIFTFRSWTMNTSAGKSCLKSCICERHLTTTIFSTDSLANERLTHFILLADYNIDSIENT